jgi:DNA polymerase IV
LGVETTFAADLLTHETCMDALRPLIEKLSAYAIKRNIAGRTLTLKLRYADFKTVTRSRSFLGGVADVAQIESAIEALLVGLCPLRAGVRLLGVTLSNLEDSAGDDGQALLL